MKRTFLFLVFALSFGFCQAQDFEFGEVDRADVDMTKYAKDTSAQAVVLKEFGKTWISSADHIPLIHEYHVKIKILNPEAFREWGDVKIPLYKEDDNYFESVRDIKAITYYRDENNLLRQAELDPKNIFHTKLNRYYDQLSFALPHLTKGCVIEYKYTLESPRRWSFKEWNFQADIPKIYSEYEVHIPGIYVYNASLRGALKLTKVNSDIDRDCFSFNGIKCDCSKITYIMTDIPAFKEEAFMTSPKNFMSAINFELSEYTNFETGARTKVTKEWKDIDYDLKHNESFGSQLRRTELMKDRIKGVGANTTDPLEKAKAIFEFVQKNYRWNNIYSIGSDDGIRKAFDSHSGSVADINLSLVAALNAAGINTEAVLLSTRNNGVINKLYPGISDFNYVIAKANIGDQSYLLDATDPLLPFGLLPLKCMNDQGRVMSLDKPSYWIDLKAEKQTKTYAFDLKLTDDGKLKGSMTCYSRGYDAYNKRKQIKNFNTVDEYVEDLDNRLKKMKILKSEIHNLDSLEQPLAEKYEIEINAYDDMQNDKRLSFNPFLYDRTTSNPFKLAERTFPVDCGAPSEERFILTVHLPDKMTTEALPQQVGLALPNQGGRFLLGYTPTDDGFNCSYSIQFNRSLYSSEEYPYLKEMYNKIIQAESAEVVFKKK
ncbi:transglutaminase superfamily protein [Mucilaginibacter yixingensis]|uniref:Transglutaminase superfamily protein n=1 Tax=Mucilaginibacter yixingensis TaxID=1295612 RepID=A0A2T5J5V6_9SPHI|nr:DUF3857 domain-containing protein [Mucilaginibacter yixingensis]PTQ93634.1 transglutaminase superfamily protein [Mucilaginibacter yixingensis]